MIGEKYIATYLQLDTDFIAIFTQLFGTGSIHFRLPSSIHFLQNVALFLICNTIYIFGKK